MRNRDTLLSVYFPATLFTPDPVLTVMKNVLLPLFLATLGAAMPMLAAESSPPPATPSPAAPHAIAGPFAVVNGVAISAADFDQAARAAYRQKFYHGKPPEAEVNRLLQEIGQSLIDRVLLTQEVGRRQIAADQASVDGELASYEARYANSPAWKEQRERTLPQLRAFLEDKSRLKVLETTVRNEVKVTPAEVRRYYDEHPQAFTEPEKVRVSTILLKVDPSSTSDVWKQAMSEGEKVRGRIDAGADFAETARLQSGDASTAGNGGDMGYIHRGMLGDEVHQALDKIQPGAVVGPLRLLQGVALFKLADRKAPQLQSFDKVAARAEGLVQREKSEQAWKNFLVVLRRDAKIDVAPAFAQVMQGEPTATKKN